MKLNLKKIARKPFLFGLPIYPQHRIKNIIDNNGRIIPVIIGRRKSFNKISL